MPVIVVGAGGHALVVADALLAVGAPVLGFTDAASHRHGERCLGDLLVMGNDEALSNHDPARVRLVNGLGGIRACECKNNSRARGGASSASGIRRP
jgi:UDP-perosamine 4-acetyltransferase